MAGGWAAGLAACCPRSAVQCRKRKGADRQTFGLRIEHAERQDGHSDGWPGQLSFNSWADSCLNQPRNEVAAVNPELENY